MCGCFDNCVGVLVIVYLYLLCFVMFRLCIFILISFVCTSARTAATERKLNCSNNNNNKLGQTAQRTLRDIRTPLACHL
jgi:ABC-type bacteriocin/lantibiotic exporter with double-glycine peptidase domain